MRAGVAARAEGLDAVQHAEAVADGGDAHLLERGMVEVEDDVAANVVLAEDIGLVTALAAL